MKYNKLGKNGPMVSNICLGTWPIGGGMGTVSEKDCLNTIESSLDQGVNFLDTAQMYLESENILGKALGGKRDKIILASKLSSWNSIEDIDRAIENSLRELKTDYIDLYQVHSWKTEIPMEETISRLINLSDKGYFKYLGVSNFNSEQIEEMNSHSGDRIISNQPHYSLLFRNSEIDPIPQSHKLGIGSIVYSPIGRGLLTGKYKPGHNFKRNDARFGHTAFSKENFERGYKIYEVLYEWSKDKNYNVSQLVIAWTLHTTGVVSAICGAKNPEQAISNAQAGDINLTQDDLDEINKMTKELSIFDKT
ncbi:MAG: hypothetical protein CL715_03370 [Chloroflexi bacterium]|nr:hypothetical protein [Chloroflexota bacterium]|tara:strand:- start:2793 stop:3713 length:921 start_codon:yes stop_codon:yes gene_type:complete